MSANPSLSPLEFQTQGRDLVIVTLRPALSEAPWAEIEQSGDEVIAHLGSTTRPRCVIDLSPLTYMGSSLVALMVRIWKSVRSRQGTCVVACPNEVVRQVIDLAGLDKVWTIVDSREEAFRRLNVAPNGEAVNAGWKLAVLVLGLLAAVVAISGASLDHLGQGAPRTNQWLSYGGAAAAFLSGLVTLLCDRSRRRYLGLIVLLAGTAVALYSVASERRDEAPISAAATSSPDGNRFIT